MQVVVARARPAAALITLTARSTVSCFLPLTRTLAPVVASPFAIAKPMPAVEPVTRADLPERLTCMADLPIWPDGSRVVSSRFRHHPAMSCREAEIEPLQACRSLSRALGQQPPLRSPRFEPPHCRADPASCDRKPSQPVPGALDRLRGLARDRKTVADRNQDHFDPDIIVHPAIELSYRPAGSDRRNLLGRGHGHVPHRRQHCLDAVPGMVWTATGGLGPVTLLTNTFMHGGFLHVLLNMWTFCVFGLALS